MFSVKIQKNQVRGLVIYGGLALFVVLLALLTVHGAVFASPSLGESTTEPPPPPPVIPPPPVEPDRDEAKCKMLVYPTTINLGEPFEVCWVGHKFSDVALGPDRSLTPSEADPYLKTLDNGKTLYCHSFLVPSASNSNLNPGVYDFRCSGPGGTILATTVNVVP